MEWLQLTTSFWAVCQAEGKQDRQTGLGYSCTEAWKAYARYPEPLASVTFSALVQVGG